MTAGPERAPLLSVRDLAVAFPSVGGPAPAVRGVDLDVAAGEVVALVGESGSGKSVTALTLLGLTRGRGVRVTGSARFDGTELVGAPDAVLRSLRGRDIAMVFQDPSASLNPVVRVGAQIAEAIRAHEAVPRRQARRRAVELLGEVGISSPEDRAHAFPHELSGGMRQRVMIAMALAGSPRLLLADEPTTALDVTVQAGILDLLLRLRDERGMAVLLVTHDLGVVAQVADRVSVMYAGRIVESARVDEVFDDPRHPYTWGLLGSIPPMDGPRPARLPAIPGTPPSPGAVPAGCAFAPRCPHRFDRCDELPPLGAEGDPTAEASPPPGAHADRCWLPERRRAELRRGPDGRIGLVGATPQPVGAGELG